VPFLFCVRLTPSNIYVLFCFFCCFWFFFFFVLVFPVCENNRRNGFVVVEGRNPESIERREGTENETPTGSEGRGRRSRDGYYDSGRHHT
jgi:hypothetical protein